MVIPGLNLELGSVKITNTDRGRRIESVPRDPSAHEIGGSNIPSIPFLPVNTNTDEGPFGSSFDDYLAERGELEATHKRAIRTVNRMQKRAS
jgi:hypothetical protein